MNEPNTQLAIQNEEPSVALMLQGVISKGITADNADALEKMMGLYERMEDKKAEKAFNAAFVSLQQSIPEIVATSEIPNRGKYERFEDVMRVVSPLLQKNGFSVTFNQQADEKRITVTCHLRHIDGHSSSNSFSVRLGGRADSDTQADCKASTTAKRNALLQALNIVIRQDIYQSDEADATMEGSPITAAQAADLRALCEEVNADKKKFLAFAGAATFEEISSTRLPELMKEIEKKRAAK